MDSRDGNKLTDKALADIARLAPGTPVRTEGGRIEGKVVKAWVEKGTVVATIKMDTSTVKVRVA